GSADATGDSCLSRIFRKLQARRSVSGCGTGGRSSKTRDDDSTTSRRASSTTLRWTKRVIIFVAITRMRFPRGFLLSRRGELTSGRDRHNYLTRVRRVAGRALDLAGNGGGSSALQV